MRRWINSDVIRSRLTGAVGISRRDIINNSDSPIS